VASIIDLTLLGGGIRAHQGGRVSRWGGAGRPYVPINFILKAPGTERLKLKCDYPLSNFAFKFNLRRYI
jgi:hypothetical protein